MDIPDPLAVLCTLLDRSVRQIADACADARVFDRMRIVRVADVWDNNTFPLFGAAVGKNMQSPEARALTALLWMAEFHRDWMVEQAAIAGFALDEALPPSPFGGPYRDYSGKIRPWPQPLAVSVIDETAADYELTAAQVTSFHAERAGRRLDALVNLAVPRRFAHDAALPATVSLQLQDVAGLEVTAADLHGAAIAVTDAGLEVTLGAGGFVRAAGGRLRIDDTVWHQSAAGHRADAEAPPQSGREKRPRLDATLSGLATEAARKLRATMWEIRTVRYIEHVDVAALSANCEPYAGAGTLLLDAARRRTARRRTLRRLADASLSPTEMRAAVLSAHHPGEPAAELRMIAYTAAHERYRPHKESLLRHYATPPDTAHATAPWRISVLRDPEPSAFSVRIDDFHAAAFLP